MKRHQYGISALVSKTSFGGESSGRSPKCQLFSQARVTRTDDVDVVKEKSVSQLQLTFTICC